MNNGFTYLGGYTRTYTTRIPGLKDEDACPNKDDRFTVRDTAKGNGKLTYPVGLITADEVAVAGHGNGSNSYLYTGEYYWLLSPSRASGYGVNSYEMHVRSDGMLIYGSLNYNGVRPSIVLKKGIVAARGDGTSEQPYIVE